jgi:hypothetical protein
MGPMEEFVEECLVPVEALAQQMDAQFMTMQTPEGGSGQLYEELLRPNWLMMKRLFEGLFEILRRLASEVDELKAGAAESSD